jgi:Protein of unknown function with HXXEE motif
MNFRYLQLLFPILVALHNAEEATGMPRWARRSGPWFAGVEPSVFRFAILVITIFAFVVTILSAVQGRMTMWGNLTFGFMAAMLLNSLFPHIAVSVARRTLMPGVITAAVLNLPVLSCLMALALRQRYVSGHDALVFSIAVPALLLLMIPLLFKIGKAFAFSKRWLRR